MFGSCFRMLAVTLVSDLFFVLVFLELISAKIKCITCRDCLALSPIGLKGNSEPVQMSGRNAVRSANVIT